MDKDNRKKVIIIILLIIIIILLYLLIHLFGNIEHHGLMVPTGNVDIFELDCGCGCYNPTNPEDDNPAFNEDDENNNLIVYDKEKIWDNNTLRIFTNPAYEFQSKIAPGSKNSYAFVIRNNNDFDVIVRLQAIETNDYNINMQYRLTHMGKYVVGSETSYTTVDNLKLNNVLIKAHSQKSYILDWKWIDSSNDTEIGFTIDAYYKLKLIIGAKAA